MQLDVYGAVTRANIKEGKKIISWLKLKCAVVPGDVTASYLTAVTHIIRTSGYAEQGREKNSSTILILKNNINSFLR